jgi:hypothetical protein
MTFVSRLAPLFAVALAACSSTITAPLPDVSTDFPGDPLFDAGFDGAPSDGADFCMLPNGGRCARGAACPAGDGCNTCSCYGPGPLAACTAIGCSPPDSGVRTCTTRAQCRSGEICNFIPSGCASTGVCVPITPCAEPRVYCACDGTTYTACVPDQSTRNEGSCAPPDAGPVACRSTADCGGGTVCLFSAPGCGVTGVCGTPRDCAFITEYCGCEGGSFRDCPGGVTSRPYTSTGPCGDSDGGAAPACVGARFASDGRSCVGPTGSPVSPDCCVWNCDVRVAACDSLPPPCPGGQVNTVTGACWGPCVAPTACSPMTCSAMRPCVRPWVCDPSAGRCVYGG